MASALIGRRAELAWLRARVDLALGGFAHLVFVEGESGIGKTRLAQEALEHARRRRAAVLRGRCYDHLDLPYLPAARLAVRGDGRRPGVAGSRRRPGRGRTGPGRRRGRTARRPLRPTPSSASAPGSCSSSPTSCSTTCAAPPRSSSWTTSTGPTPPPSTSSATSSSASTTSRCRCWCWRRRAPTRTPEPPTAVARLRSEPAHRGACTSTRSHRWKPPSSHASASPARRSTARATSPSASGGNPLLVEALARDRRARPTLLGERADAPDRRGHRARPSTRSRRRASQVVLTVAVLGPDAHRRRVARGRATPMTVAVDDAIDAGVLVEDGTRARVQPPDVRAHRVRPCAPASARHDLHREAAAILLRTTRGGPPPRRGRRGDRSRRPRARACCGQRRARPRRVGRGRALLRGRARRPAAHGGAGRAPPARRPQPARQPAAGAGRRPLRGRARARSATTPTPRPAPSSTSGASVVRSAPTSMLDVVRDRGPLEALVDEVEADSPELAAEALVELSQSYWVEWRMQQATQVRGAGDGHRGRQRRPLRVRAGDDRHERAAVGALRPARDRSPRWRTASRTRARRTTTRCSRAARCSARRSCSRGWAASPRPRTRAHRVLRHRRTHAVPARARSAARLRSRSSRSRAASTTQAEQYAHRALLLQRLSGYHWAAGLFLPPLACAYVARGQYEQARAGRSPRGPRPPTRSSSRASTSSPAGSPRANAGSRCSAHRCRASRRTRWSAPTRGRCWQSSSPSAKAPSGDLRAAHDLLEEIEELGGVLIGGTATLAARHLGVAKDLLGDEDGAIATLERAIARGRHRSAPPPSWRAPAPTSR